MQSVTITLNGREVSGYPEMTILELARESGVDIPTLCHDTHLTPIGACRVCLVEDEPTGRLMASCVTPIAAGMVINTNSPRVIEHRKTIIKLMLASHPDSCIVCDKGNRCQLRQIASDMGIGLVEFERIPKIATIEEVNPFIERDLSKCILCAKCIRACQELVVEGAINYFRRGFIAKVATLDDLPLEDSECTFCGTCVSLCPTGALMEKDRTYAGTTKASVETTCPFCGCGCSIYLEVKGNHIVRVRPGNQNGLNNSTLCVRGSYGYDFVHSPDRLAKPLVKVNGSFEEVSWEQALEHVATEFKRIKDEHGSNSLAVLGSSKCTNEENYLLQRFARCVLGTNNIDNGSRLYNSATRIGLGYSIGSLGITNQLSALEQSEVIIVIGANPSSSAPLVGYAIKRAVKYKGARLILIDPRRTDLSSFAHLRLRPKVGTDVAFLNSLAKVIIDEGLFDEGSVTREKEDFEALTKALEKYSPEYVEAITGVPGDEIPAAAQLYAKAGQAAIVYGTGITQNACAVDSIKTLANLAILTGNSERAGGGIYALQRENNSQGACDMGALPDFLPGYESVADAQVRRKFEEHWEVSLPAKPGLTAMEIIEQAREGQIKGMWIVGENPVLSFPNRNLIDEALASLDFLVVQDMFLTETAKLATVVLPATSFAEKEGTFTNFEGRVNRVRKAIEPIGESLPDWEIILMLADKMNNPLPFSSLQQVTDEVEQLVPLFKAYAHSEKRSDGEQLSKGFTRFMPVEYTPQVEGAKEDYPLTLLAGTILYHFGSGTRSSRAWRLKKFSLQAFVEIGEFNAKKLGISHGDKVKVVSPTGELTTTVTITDTLPSGILFMPISSSESPVSALFSIVLDPETKTPSLKACNVRIERIGG
ncbi:putative formate dehydrogenase [subsurface metagenome]